MKKLLITLLALTTSASAFAGFEGYWMVKDGEFMIHIVKDDSGEYKGYVDWLKFPKYPEGDKMAGVEQFDRNNDDKSLRDRKILGLQNVGGLRMNKDGELENGWVYDTWNGDMYYASAKLIDDDTLSLKGSFDKWGWLGYAMKAHRVKDTSKYFTDHVPHHE